MLDVTSVSFDVTGCTLQEQGETHRVWVKDHIVHKLIYKDRSIGWPFEVTDLEAASEFYRRQCAHNGGVMLSIERTSAAGFPTFRGIFKYRVPVPGSRGMYFVGILWLPFEDCYFQINIEALEWGTTGMREAVIMLAEPDLWPPRPPDDEIPIINSEEELEQLRANTPLVALPSDDERFDEGFPDHPLSLIRARLPVVASSLTIREASEAPKPTPKKDWRFWRK